MSNKLYCKFDGFDVLAEQLDEISHDIKPAVTDCLQEAHHVVTTSAQQAIKKHHLTGATEASLVRASKVIWNGNVAESDVGFRIRQGGLPSIFLMYGTPRIKKDQQLYNAFYGKKTRTEIEQKQRDIMIKNISLGKK